MHQILTAALKILLQRLEESGTVSKSQDVI